MAWLMVISIIRRYILRKHAVICVCSQVNAEVSSALHQLCLPQQPVKAACVVCEGADSDDPQQCTCKCVFLVHTYIFLHLCKNICYTKSLYWLYFCPDCSMIIHKACCDSAPLCVKVSVCVLKIWHFTYKCAWIYDMWLHLFP